MGYYFEDGRVGRVLVNIKDVGGGGEGGGVIADGRMEGWLTSASTSNCHAQYASTRGAAVPSAAP